MQSDSNIVIVDLFNDVVAGMRVADFVTSSVEVTPGVYTITASNELNNQDVVTIASTDYVIRDVSGDGFTIDAGTGQDFANEEWQAKAPYYMHGHPLEVTNRLTNKNKSNIYSYQKYPLILLVQDFEEGIGEDLSNYASGDFTVIIANLTKPDITADERYNRNFRDILYPLYNEFIKGIHASNAFYTRSVKTIPHTKVDRLYWGTSAAQGNENNYQHDYIDAIEITFNNLQIVDTRCLKNI